MGVFNDLFLDMYITRVLACYGHKPDEYAKFAEAVGMPLEDFKRTRVGELRAAQIKTLCIRMWVGADELLGLDDIGEL